MFNLKLFVSVLAIAIAAASPNKKLKTRDLSVLHEWKDFEFGFPVDSFRDFSIKSGLYVKGNGIPVDFEIEYGENSTAYRTFVAIPRLTSGIPYTLAVLKNEDGDKSPQLFPYPSIYYHTSHGADCGGITSAIRIFIDECWRLWVVDSGQIASVQLCSPQIFVFNLLNNQLIKRYEIPHTQYVPGVSVFTSALVDVRDPYPDQCIDTRMYIADPWGYGLIVYDAMRDMSWRVEHELMQPDRGLLRNNFLSDGIFSISLSPKDDPVRKMYFHALSSKRQIVVPLNTIDDDTIWQENSEAASDDFAVLGNRRIQCESETTDRQGNLYCSLLRLNAIITWDGKSTYNSDNLKIYAHNREQLRFVTSMKVLKNAHGEDELWALSNDPKLFFGGNITSSLPKFRIVGCRIKDLLAGSPCSVDAS